MKKYLLLLLAVPFITGSACSPSKPDETCAEVPIYQPYSIDVPVRPVLSSDKLTPNDSEGFIVRVVEDDFALLMEYALKLENLIKAVPKSLVDPVKKP